MTSVEIESVLDLLPHRYPMLLVDKVLHCSPGESIVVVKNVTHNEAFFQGHFPNQPIMPGVLILESMAQATGLLAFYSFRKKAHQGDVFYLVGVDKARFKQPVRPGDQLVLHVVLKREIKGMYRFGASAKVADQVVASAEIMTTKADSEP